MLEFVSSLELFWYSHTFDSFVVTINQVSQFSLGIKFETFSAFVTHLFFLSYQLHFGLLLTVFGIVDRLECCSPVGTLDSLWRSFMYLLTFYQWTQLSPYCTGMLS